MAVQALVAALFLSVYLSTTDAEGAAAAKPGVCPRNNVEDAKLGVCAEMCSRDSDCPNDQKCCSNGCGHQCVAPYKEKPGVCPSDSLTVGVCVESCSLDSDCPNNQKCCSNGCGHQCTPPYEAKPGVCPRNDVKTPKLGVCAEMCSDDSDCPNDQKCCSNECGHQCMPPYEDQAKAGMCPKKNVDDAELGVCAEMCSRDRDCPNDQKCCSNGCGHQCVAPYQAKPGVCPNKPGIGLCVEKCSHDSDCPNDQKCCSNGCGHQCMPPYEVRPCVGLKPNVR